MALELGPLTTEVIEAAAGLASQRCQGQREATPQLPASIGRPATWRPYLQRIIERGSGVAAWRDGELAGFIGAWRMPAFRGQPTMFSPEWANAAAAADGRRVYQAMYAYLAERWLDQGYLRHIFSLPAYDRAALETWHWLGFGAMGVDAIRGLEPAAGGGAGVTIRRAGLAQLDEVMALAEALRQHSAGSPIFLMNDPQEASSFEPWLDRPDQVIWLAYRDGQPVAFMRQGPANEDVCQLIVDQQTSSISGAYTSPQARGQEVGTSLLNQALQWAKEQGYRRLAVDFEPMNHWAARFWLRHFRPVVLSVERRLEARA